jgi:ectoine hydroxylase-related dioxygenase (phytanoyl-CoA dioxygenase family)
MTRFPLTREQIESFERDGFVAVRHLITPEQVEELRADYDRALRGEIPVPEFEGNKQRGMVVQLSSPSRHIPGWAEHAYFRNALSVARQLLGDDLEYQYDQIIFKPPHAGSPTDWHQDAGYWKEGGGADRAVTCWLALSPAFPENGCMQFIPGSHRGPIQPHFDVSDRSPINNALATTADASRAVACPLAPGDASFHHCRTLHYTGGNMSDTPRHGLITHFFPTVRK